MPAEGPRLLLTLLVEVLPPEGGSARPAAIVREQATCEDIFGLVHELDDQHLTYGRFRRAIDAAYMDGSRLVDAPS